MENNLISPPYNLNQNSLNHDENRVEISDTTQTTSNQFPKKTFLFKRLFKREFLISGIVLLLLVLGGASALFLSSNSQDVRQQASGCVYWNGEAATEGAVDNRDGIRQECKNGLWTVPDDGNLDPSEIIAEEEAARPKRPCVSWDGSEVPHGSVDIRGDIRQECKDGYWDAPKDGITDPNQVGALEVSKTVAGMESGELTYQQSVQIYNAHCRESVSSGAAVFCNRLNNLLNDEAARIRAKALTDAVKANTESVTQALAGLNNRSLQIVDANKIYEEYCTGAKALQTSVSTCQSLKASIDEQTNLRQEAENASNAISTEKVNSTLANVINNPANIDNARAVYQEYCIGVNALQNPIPQCGALNSEINKIIQLRETAEAETYIIQKNTQIVTATIEALANNSVGLNDARSSYQKYCAGEAAAQTSIPACTALKTNIDEIVRVREAAVAAANASLTVTVTSNNAAVDEALSGLINRTVDINSARSTYQQYCVENAPQTSPATCSELASNITSANLIREDNLANDNIGQLDTNLAGETPLTDEDENQERETRLMDEDTEQETPPLIVNAFVQIEQSIRGFARSIFNFFQN